MAGALLVSPAVFAVFHALLAQAEPTRAEPSQAEPAQPEPVAGEPAPAEFGPAEPAPASSEPGGFPAPVEPPPATSVGLALRLGTRLPLDDEDLPAARGFGLAVLIQHRYLLIGDRLELGAGIDFAFERYSRSIILRSAAPPGGGAAPPAFEQTRQLTHSTFAFMHPVAVRLGRVRIALAPGAGLDVAYYASDERAALGEDAPLPDELRATRVCLRGSAAVELFITRHAAVGLGADYTHVFATPSVTTGAGRTYRPIVDRLALGLALVYGF